MRGRMRVFNDNYILPGPRRSCKYIRSRLPRLRFPEWKIKNTGPIGFHIYYPKKIRTFSPLFPLQSHSKITTLPECHHVARFLIIGQMVGDGVCRVAGEEDSNKFGFTMLPTPQLNLFTIFFLPSVEAYYTLTLCYHC